MIVTARTDDASKGWLEFAGRRYPCALGKAGITANKREGDHATPAGRYPLRRLLYRADKLATPECALPVAEIKPEDGWCDASGHAEYNRPVRLPFTASHEKMRRADGLYDLVVVIGHNDAPVVPGAGSCIFMHVAREGYSGTEGCIALKKGDLLELLSLIEAESRIDIRVPDVETS
ncbi:MAG: hypothetical protein EP348_05875 [Alphaproteobacteria bacterium]|nr:MAG: hypothetical protein EP348_05875 [Alphaproteobacteria bacterium]